MSDPNSKHDASAVNAPAGQSDASAVSVAHSFSESHAKRARKSRSARAGRSRKVAPVDEGGRERLRAQTMSAELAELEDARGSDGGFSPDPDSDAGAAEGAAAPSEPPQGPPYTEADAERDVGDVTRLALLGIAYVRARKKNTPHDARRVDGRVSRIAQAVAPRVVGRFNGALFWAGLAADVACEFMEDAIGDALAANRAKEARTQTVNGAVLTRADGAGA